MAIRSSFGASYGTNALPAMKKKKAGVGKGKKKKMVSKKK